MKASIIALFMTVLSVSGCEIFQYHEDFRILLEHSEQLEEIPRTVATFASTLDDEVEVFAAENVSASSELLYTSAYMLLQQHATLVDIYVKTSTFQDSYIQPSIAILLRNCAKVRAKCKKYLKVVRNPQLFQQILNLDEIARDIEEKLGKYVPKQEAKPPATPKAEAPVQGK